MAWCWGCYFNGRRKANIAGHAYYRRITPPSKRFEEYVIVKKPTGKTAGARTPSGDFPDQLWLEKFPTICVFMTDDKWDDGTPREVSVLSVSVRDGMMALALNDKDLKQSMYTMAETVAEALGLLECALADGTGQWRPWKAGKKR